ncbi:MAG: ASKHA domain-containing protein [Candidatus Gastranaerophilales bacterium]|nr:ASKHA domain-containing protein [Candidatus Gastranaerophilales bacterium]
MSDRICRICTGCGRCAGVRKDISILTRSPLSVEGGSLVNAAGRRLAAVDIGTTTIAMELMSPAGEVQDRFVAVNPQTEYGADVISRIQRTQNENDAARMQSLVREALREGIKQFAGQIGKDETLFMVIAANTTMVYLLMGYDARELGQAPFAASRLETARLVIDGVLCVIVPGKSAFVGGDITAGIHACRMAEQEELTILVDLGTNGELALGNCHGISACATAAGPAFEGGVNRGIWGADLVSLLARLRKEGILDETGLLADPYFDEGIMIGGVRVTQEAVRAVQLAKGAILTGIHVLARRRGVRFDQISKVVLSGGFGYYLDPEAAAQIGLLPMELADRTVAGGNTALAGAARLGRQILCEDYPEDYLETAWEKAGCGVEVLNLARQAGFEEQYLQAMELRPYG